MSLQSLFVFSFLRISLLSITVKSTQFYKEHLFGQQNIFSGASLFICCLTKVVLCCMDEDQETWAKLWAMPFVADLSNLSNQSQAMKDEAS